mmetsp:Transcript_42439/g.65117  ORF Transcript_42439/g.65117 Transcript_42439/m.65117 type:complete len:138 (+) Transcript_42439:3363-3776(+)
MINEREGYFTEKDLNNASYFPSIVVVRRVKTNLDAVKSTWQSFRITIKNYIKTHFQKCVDAVQKRANEQQAHFSNSIKVIELDIQNVNKDLEKIFKELQNLSALHSAIDANLSRNQGIDSSNSSGFDLSQSVAKTAK